MDAKVHMIILGFLAAYVMLRIRQQEINALQKLWLQFIGVTQMHPRAMFLYNLDTNSFFVSRDVVFKEEIFPFKIQPC